MTSFLLPLGKFGLFVGAVALRVATPPWNLADLWSHTWKLGLRCIGPVSAVTLPFGMVMALQGLAIFDLFGVQRLLSPLVVNIVIRELSPVMASVLVAAQGGSAFAAELGAMRIKEELDATEVMAVDALRWHVVPRVLALMIATPVLEISGAAVGILGGYVMAVLVQGEPEGTYVGNLWVLSVPIDVYGGVIKAVVYGAMIGLISCYHGFFVTGGAAGVGRGVNDTVVQSVLAIFAANYLLSSLFRGLG